MARNVAQSLAATAINVDVDDYDSKPPAVVFSTAGNVTQPLEATAGNKTQSLAATASNVTQSLAATARKIAKENNQKIEEDQDILDDDDRKPASVVFATAGNVTHPLVATAGKKTQSLAVMASNVTQSLADTASDGAQSTVAATDSHVAKSLAVMASNVVQSTVAATGNTEAELASFSPETIAEDAAAREMLLEQPPLTPQVIEKLLAIFHPIICLQLLTVLPFIFGWLQMMLPLEKNWKNIAKQRPF
jgi:aminopeptidase N